MNDPQYDELSIAQKLALVFIVLGKETAASLTISLQPHEIKEISYWITRMENIPISLAIKCLNELQERIIKNSPPLKINGGNEYLQSILSVIKEQSHTQKSISQTQINFYEVLNHANSQELANYFKNEQEETVALIFSTLDPSRTATILSEMPIENAVNILITIANMDHLTEEKTKALLDSMREILDQDVNSFMQQKQFLLRSAQIVENISYKHQSKLLQKLGEINPELYQKIRDLIFVFDDFQYFNDSSIAALCHRADPIDLRLAFYDTSNDLQTKFFAHIPKKQLDKINQKLATLDSITDLNILTAQRKIIKLLHDLEKENKIKREEIFAFQKNDRSQKEST